MADKKRVDLSNFSKGVTLYISFADIGEKPFYVSIYDPNSPAFFYKRKFNKKHLMANLPVHTKEVQIEVDGSPKITQAMVGPIKRFQIPYIPNHKLKVFRPYGIDKIRIRKVRGLPQGSEARFLYNKGIIEYDVDRMRDLPQPVKYFILNHELGHYFYGSRPVPRISDLSPFAAKAYQERSLEDEKECDRFALYRLINEGYNFSGTLDGLKDTLKNYSHFNFDRINSLYKEINKMNTQIQ